MDGVIGKPLFLVTFVVGAGMGLTNPISTEEEEGIEHVAELEIDVELQDGPDSLHVLDNF